VLHGLLQTATVRVYRLITKKTYESEMFRRASRKLGLSQAVFETGGIRRTFKDDKEEEPKEGGLVNLLKLDKDKVLVEYGQCV
jgi:SNF2 family DNA or RNA helicase